MDIKVLQAKYEALAPVLTERSRRLWAATEALVLGHGGIALVARATGIAHSTISRGIQELKSGETLSPDRSRRPGGGRKRTIEKDWVSQTEGAKFWLQVLTELRNRGVSDIIIACVDGLTGFPEAIETAFPKTQVQLCIVHQVRNARSYVSYKDRKAVAADMKKIYKSAPLEEAEQHLASLGQTWNQRYPTIHRSWDRHWEQLTAFFAYPPEIRKVIYTTNAIESLNSSMRKDPEDPSCLPQRRGGDQADVSGPPEHRQALDTASERLEESTQSVCHHVRGPSAVTRTLTRGHLHKKPCRS